MIKMIKPAPLYKNKNYSNIIGRPDNDNSLDYLFWKFRMNIESCWGLAMLVYRFQLALFPAYFVCFTCSLETWEYRLVVCLLILTSSLLLFSFIFYAPQQLSNLKYRLAYYLFGNEKSQREILAVLNEWLNIFKNALNFQFLYYFYFSNIN